MQDEDKPVTDGHLYEVPGFYLALALTILAALAAGLLAGWLRSAP
jgi:hypothetical protein